MTFFYPFIPVDTLDIYGCPARLPSFFLFCHRTFYKVHFLDHKRTIPVETFPYHHDHQCKNGWSFPLVLSLLLTFQSHMCEWPLSLKLKGYGLDALDVRWP